MARKILCVAEKPAIARAVATHMSGGSFQTVSDTRHHRRVTFADQGHSMQSEAINMSRTMSLTSISVAHGEIAR